LKKKNFLTKRIRTKQLTILATPLTKNCKAAIFASTFNKLHHKLLLIPVVKNCLARLRHQRFSWKRTQYYKGFVWQIATTYRMEQHQNANSNSSVELKRNISLCFPEKNFVLK
jgi:hypothetical protein